MLIIVTISSDHEKLVKLVCLLPHAFHVKLIYRSSCLRLRYEDFKNRRVMIVASTDLYFECVKHPDFYTWVPGMGVKVWMLQAFPGLRFNFDI